MSKTMIDRNRSQFHFRIRNLMKIESYHTLRLVDLDLHCSLIKKLQENTIFILLEMDRMVF